MSTNSEEKNWQCIDCKQLLTLQEAKEHAKLGGYHACYPLTKK